MVPLVRKSSGGDSVKPSGGKLHSFRSREDRHQKGTSRLMVKRENTDLKRGVQGEQLSLFIVFTTEKCDDFYEGRVISVSKAYGEHGCKAS